VTELRGVTELQTQRDGIT